MRKVAFYVAKGGAGKTTLAGCTAYHASRKGVRTVLVDNDAQGNASSWYLKGSVEHELADCLKGEVEVQKALVPLSPTFSVLPTASIGGELKKYAETKLAFEPFVYDDLNGALAGLGYELVVYDLAPSFSMLERCAILSCDEVVMPLTGEYFSIDGHETFRANIAEINKAYKRNVEHTKAVLNNVNLSYSKHREAVEVYHGLKLRLFVVPQDRNIAECQFSQLPLWEYNPRSRAIPALEELTAAIVGG